VRRGYTLIELMVAVAIGGITAAGAVGGVTHLQRMAAGELHRERALQVLEYEAASRLGGPPSRPEVRARLLAELPHGTFQLTRGPEHTLLTVRWSVDGKTHHRSLPLVGVTR